MTRRGRAGATWAALAAGLLGVTPTAGAAGPPASEGARASEGALVAPPGVACEAEPDDVAAIEAEGRKRLGGYFAELTPTVIGHAEGVAAQFWGDKVAAERARFAAAAPAPPDTAIQSRRRFSVPIPPEACREVATADTAECYTMENATWREACFALVTAWADHRRGKPPCARVTEERQPACRLVFGRDPTACDGATGAAIGHCDDVRAVLGQDFASCHRPGRQWDFACVTQLIYRSVLEGEGACERMLPRDDRDPAVLDYARVACLAMARGEPDACPPLPRVALAGDPTALAVTARAVLVGGAPASRLVLLFTANRDALCAGRATVTRAGAPVLTTTFSFPAHRADVPGDVLDGPAVAGEVDPFGDEVSLETLCVPAPPWGMARPAPGT